MDLIIKWTWEVTAPLHVGSGLSRPGLADRLIRLTAKGEPFIPGDAVKGAIRGAAERLVRWLHPSLPPEAEDHSRPVSPVLQRIFSPEPKGPIYRFHRADYCPGSGNAFVIASTAVDPRSGVAKEGTLRSMQAWGRGARFRGCIEGYGGQWHKPDSEDYRDLLVLLAALLLTEDIGGRRSAGFGQLRLLCWESNIPGLNLAEVWRPETVEQIRSWLSGAASGQREAKE
jgi:CRISPR/Cas system CSM-associated protein Csm3 (group 7 of RAMP superfamily)